MDDIKQLDLAKFEKITPPSPEQISLETAKRSQGLQTIRTLMEQTLNAMQSYLTDLSDLDGQQKIIDQEKAELGEIDKQLRYSQHQLEKKEQSINEQLAYIESKNKELTEKKLTIETLKEEQIKSNNEAVQELEKKTRELVAKEAQIKVSKDRLNDLKDMQSAITASQAVDAERKSLLDRREQKILEREARLARLEQDARIG